MIWLLLLAFVAATVFIDSARLFLLGLLVMAIKACPQIVLSFIAAVTWWAFNQLRS